MTLAQRIILEIAHHGQRVLESLDFLLNGLIDRQVFEGCERPQLLCHLVSAGDHPGDVQISPQLLGVLAYIVSMLRVDCIDLAQALQLCLSLQSADTVASGIDALQV